MSTNTSIEWTDSTWSPIRARVKSDAERIARTNGYTSLVAIAAKMAGRVGPHCEHVSPGCNNCYADTNNGRCLPANGTGLPYDRRSRDLVEPFLDNKMLRLPLHWKRPRKIFVENQSDLWGEWVSDDFVDKVFAVMALCPQHTFQCLTKRPERMREYFADVGYRQEMIGIEAELRSGMDRFTDRGGCPPRNIEPTWRLPLPNVWLGVSAENQETWDERTAVLGQVPAAVRFVSLEPQLDYVDVDPVLKRGNIHWVIQGGESGPGARPFDIAWARSVIAQCRTAGVACFVKQMGSRITGLNLEGPPYSSPPLREGFLIHWTCKTNNTFGLCDRKGGRWEEWPEDLRVREFPTERG